MKHMTKRTLLAVALSGLLGLPAGLGIQTARAAVAAAQDEKESKEKKVADLDTELAKQMEVIDGGMKKLRRSLRKAESNKESLETIEKVHAAAVKSKDMVPARAAKVPEAERAKFVAAYKKDMETLIKTVEEMQAAVKDGKNDKALELHKSLKTQEDKGHEKYTEQ
jgi:soluble cytochrome b562